MKDFLGNELNVGDEVVFILRCDGAADLKIGKIREFKLGYAYINYKWNPKDENWFEWHKGLSSVSIMKVGAQII